MKKCIVFLIVFQLCLGLCACGGSKNSIELPPIPQQMATPSLPTEAPEENAEAQDSTAGKYPWEMEFREEDYEKFQFTSPEGDKVTSWREGTIYGREAREIYEWTDGTISDSYYYPSGNISHSYTWCADGSYEECHYADTSLSEMNEDGIETIYITKLYSKAIRSDGSWSEFYNNENGIPVFSASMSADGTYWEAYYFENGDCSKEISDMPSSGYRSEREYYENGVCKKYTASNSQAGEYTLIENFENGNMKYCKIQTQGSIQEERYDEESFRIYYYIKENDTETELITDESGKLVKYVENGTVYENENIPDWVAESYNFRR